MASAIPNDVDAKITSNICHLSIGSFLPPYFNAAIILNYSFYSKHKKTDDDNITIGIGHLFVYSVFI